MDPAVARLVLGSAGTSASRELSSWELPPFCAREVGPQIPYRSNFANAANIVTLWVVLPL